MTAPTPPGLGPPESVVFGEFTGLNNRVTPERLAPSDLARADNIDIDGARQIHRRRGTTLIFAGNCHSLWVGPLGHVYLVVDGALGYLDPDQSFHAIDSGYGPQPIAYTAVGQTVYFSSSQKSGCILADQSVQSWGASNDAGIWVSPVANPSSTLPDVHGVLLTAPPIASVIEYFNSRIYLGEGRNVWATKPFLYHYVEKSRNFKQFTADITMLGAVGDGIYVGTDAGVYFLSGSVSFDEMRAEPIMTARAVPGSRVHLPADAVSKQFRDDRVKASRLAIMFLTDAGVCVGFDSGVCYNVTSERANMPNVSRAAALFREQDGMEHYVVAGEVGGNPVANARFGDYVDVNIIRALPGA